MRITISARHCDIPDILRERARARLERLGRIATRPHHAQIRHQQRRPLRRDSQLTPLATRWTMPQARQKIQLLHETALAVPHHDEDLSASGRLEKLSAVESISSQPSLTAMQRSKQ